MCQPVGLTQSPGVGFTRGTQRCPLGQSAHPLDCPSSGTPLNRHVCSAPSRSVGTCRFSPVPSGRGPGRAMGTDVTPLGAVAIAGLCPFDLRGAGVGRRQAGGIFCSPRADVVVRWLGVCLSEHVPLPPLLARISTAPLCVIVSVMIRADGDSPSAQTWTFGAGDGTQPTLQA